MFSFFISFLLFSLLVGFAIVGILKSLMGNASDPLAGILSGCGVIIGATGVFFTNIPDVYVFPLYPVFPFWYFSITNFLFLLLVLTAVLLEKSSEASRTVMQSIKEVEWKRLGLLLLAICTAVLTIPSYPPLLGFLPLTDLAIGFSLLIVSILWFTREYRIAFHFALLAGGIVTFLALFMPCIKVPTPYAVPGPAPKQDLLALIPAAGFFIAAYILLQRLRTRNDETNRPQ